MIQLGQKYYTFPLNLVCHTGKDLTNEFPIQNSLKHRNIKTTIFFNLAFGYFINVEENKGGLELNRTHQHQILADDVNSLGKNKYCNEKHKISMKC
jgi:hypothetical protein